MPKFITDILVYLRIMKPVHTISNHQGVIARAAQAIEGAVSSELKIASTMALAAAARLDALKATGALSSAAVTTATVASNTLAEAAGAVKAHA